MKKLFTLLMLLAFVGSMTFAQTKPAKEKKSDLTEKVPVDKKVKIGKLANGMTFKKGPKKRTRYQCECLDNGKIYSVSGLASCEKTTYLCKPL